MKNMEWSAPAADKGESAASQILLNAERFAIGPGVT